MWDAPLLIGSRSFRSRLILGTEGYASVEQMRRCHEAAATELVTVAVRRLDLSRPGESVLDHLDPARTTVLPDTAGAETADQAVRTAYLAREAGLGDLVRVEVTGDPLTRYPDVAAVLEATRTLAGEGFTVLAVGTLDPVAARRLRDAGAAALVVPAAPPGSGLGVVDPWTLKLVLDAVWIPVIVGAGIGTASDAALAMELGCHAVAVGTGITGARDPEAMAEAMRLAVEAGRAAYRAGRVPRRAHAGAPGPVEPAV